MKAVILESYVMEEGDLDWSGVKALVPDTTSYVRTDYADIAPRIGDAELVLINKCRIDEAILAQCPNLKWVGIIATGTNNTDMRHAFCTTATQNKSYFLSLRKRQKEQAE